MKLPNRKIKNFVEQQLAGEILIYNLSTNQAYCLNETSAKVFNFCNGTATFDELKKDSGFSDELIYLALDELKRRELIEGDYASPFAKMSRREVVRRVGLASMIALPMISSLAAPSATRAASCIASGTQSTADVGTQNAIACFNAASAKCCSRSSAGGQTLTNCNTPTVQNPCTCSVNCATVTTLPR